MSEQATNQPSTRGVDLPLGPKQELFARLLGVLINWIHTHPSWRIRLAEGFVGYTDASDGDHDGPHMANGQHYRKLAQDFDLFILDEQKVRYHVTTHHPVWDEIGAFWLSLHPLCRWGGTFKSKDYNHVSLFHEGRA